MFKLVIQDDEGKTTVVPLIRDEITIGRKEGNTIRLTERNVSRRHARILRNNGEVSIEDLGSYNGIRVNNARIAERVALRVSDQVQIGDYKLYLKAEGVEQVDDARTMPIERVDTANTATDVIPAVAAPPPTQPMPIQTPTPGTLPPAAQLIGNPNRTLVAVADTDPQGRPVASAAQVAAVLSSPAGYGKLVVLSSNFAGKEFELSRPQMIIGRTDENDIVINHRSISRNHAKLVREPDTGRYTISDLQSSNGVRVNGQDYGKVELRRGDVVDLGHVRLRFVEAGEDFVFSRDAVITDVPDSSSKKGLLFAAIAAIVVVIAVVVVLMMRKGEGDKKEQGGSNDNIAFADAGTQVVQSSPDAAAIEAEVDAGVAVAPTNDTERLRAQCLAARDAKKWGDLIACGEKLRTIDKAEGQKFYDNGHAEMKAEKSLRNFQQAMTDKALRKAADELKAIDKDSVYRADAQSAYDAAAKEAQEVLEKRLADAKKPDCLTWKKLVAQSRQELPDDIVNAASADKCTVQVAVKEPKEPKEPKDPPPPKDNPCEKFDELQSKATDAYSSGRGNEALAAYEMMYKCRPSEQMAKFATAAACKAKNIAKARTYWKKLSPTNKDAILGLCSANGFFLKDLDPNAPQ